MWGAVEVGMLVLILTSLCAQAASRLVLAVTEPVAVYVDGAQVSSPMGGRAVVNHITPGTHSVVFRGMDGQLTYESWVLIPADAEVSARYDPSRGLVITGDVGLVVTAPTGPSETRADEAVVVSDPNATGTVSSFDMNEGKTNNTNITQPDQAGGDYTQFTRAVGTVGMGVATVVAPTTTTLVTTAVGGVAATVRSAESGGISSLGKSSSTPKQGRPVPPKAITGHVKFSNLDGMASTVYLDGFVIAQFTGPTSAARAVKIEVGRHPIEIWDDTTRRPLYRGIVQVDKDYTLLLEFSGTQAPAAPERSWAWYPQ